MSRHQYHSLPLFLLMLLFFGLACSQFGDLAGGTVTPGETETDLATATTAATTAATLPPEATGTAAPPAAPTVVATTAVGPLDHVPAAAVTLFWTPLRGGEAEIGGTGDFQLTAAVLDGRGLLYMLSGDTRIFAYAFGDGGSTADALFASGSGFGDIALGPDDTLYAVSRPAPQIFVFDSSGAVSETINLEDGDAPLVPAPRRRLLAVPTDADIFVVDMPEPESGRALLLRHFDHQGTLLGWTDDLPLIIGARGLVNDPAGQLYLLPAIGPIVARFDSRGEPVGQLRINMPDGTGLCAISAATDTLFLVTSTPHGVLRLGQKGQIVDFLNLEEALPVALDWPGQQRCLVQGIAASADGGTVFLTLFPSRWERAIDHVIGYRYQ